LKLYNTVVTLTWLWMKYASVCEGCIMAPFGIMFDMMIKTARIM